MKPFVALEASAGSGKTFALSVRFVALILNGENIGEILALTFTKKAANEMKERVVKIFLNLQTCESELVELSALLGKSKDEILNLRDKYMASFLQSDLKIGTFDSFFASILRQFSINLGLSPDFSVSSNLTKLARDEFSLRVAQNSALLKALAQLIVTAQRGQNDFFETLEMFYESLNRANFKRTASLPDASRVERVLALMHDFAVQKDGSATAINSFSPASPTALLERSFLQQESLNYRTYSKIYTEELDALFSELKFELKSYFNELESYKLSQIYNFLQIYKDVKLGLNKKLNELDFSDLNILTHELLCGNLDNAMLYFRLDGRINHLLIDEFQDTNVTQYEIMKPLIAEIVAGYGQNGLGSFFYVGDIKQSIYRFRGGKKELFGKLKDDFKQIVSENLDTNYRSLKALVKFTNAVFENKIPNFLPQKANAKRDAQNVNQPEISGDCEYFQSEPDDYGFLRVVSSDEIVKEAVRQVKFLLQNGVIDDDITILCWKNDDISKLLSELEKEGIRGVGEGGLALLSSPYAGAVAEYAKFCLFGDEIYRKNTEAILDIKVARLEIRAQDSALDSIKYLVKKLGVSSANSDILRLFEIAKEYKNLANFVFNLENIDAQASAKSQNGVKIMTVHKSKGLGFEHLIVCDKIGGDRNDGSNFISEYDVKDGWKIKHNVKKQDFDSEFKQLKDKIAKLEYEEDMNKIYVAFTRAKSSLIVIKKSNPNGKNPSFFSAYTSGGKDVEYLNLSEFSFGRVMPSTGEILALKRSKIKIEKLKIAKQNLDDMPRSVGKNLNAIYFGLALHYLLEMAAKFDEISLQKAKISMQNRFYKFLREDEIEDIFTRGLNLIKDEKFREFTAGKKVLKEQPVRFENSLKQIDLLCFKDDEICIIDYKTSKQNIDENIAQITLYKKAINEIYPKFKVRAALFYALRDKIESIEI